MQRLVNAVVALIIANGTLSAFAGVAPGGALGPFYGLAPEGTQPPYIVIAQIPGLDNLQGWSTAYVGRVQLQFACVAATAATAAANAETFCTVFDVLSSITLTNGEICRKPIRLEEPRIGPSGMYGTAVRVFQVIAQYQFNVQRAKGT